VNNFTKPVRSFYIFSAALCIIIFSALNIRSQSVFINQAGYKTDGFKFFYTDSDVASFVVCRTDNNDTVYQGNISIKIENDASTGLNISKGEFSDFNTEGNFYIKVSENLASDTFSVSEDVYEDVLYKSVKGFYFWRCGTALAEPYSGVYNHEICHTNDGIFHSTAGKTGNKITTGGWHDAGDYGKYIVNAGISAGTLLMAYELFPDLFSMDNLNIPESGNGIPDILDEVRFELDWMLKMQNDDGGVFHKVAALNFPGYIMPETDNAGRYIYQISSTATADFAAVMAKAYRAFRSFDSTFANACLNAAELSASYLQNHPDIVPAGGFRNPSDSQSGSYGDSYDKDERLWAYSELYISTSNQTYFDGYSLLLSEIVPFQNEMSWPNVAQMGNISYLFLADPGDENLKSTLHNAIISYSNNLLPDIQNDGFNVSINPGEYNWGSNAVVLNRAIILILAHELTGNDEYLKAAQYQFNYILGTNAHNISFVTGVGLRYPMHIHHRPSAADNVAEPVPGYAAGGPNEYLSDDVLRRNFNSETPPALCFIDHLDSYASNEICLNWNAPLIFTAGYFNAKTYTVGVENGNQNSTPDRFILYQNYPNPFNPTTKIKYSIPASGNKIVQLKVYDVLGNLITSLIDDGQQNGTHEIIFNAANLSSGIYFYRLTAENFSSSRKMAVIK